MSLLLLLGVVVALLLGCSGSSSHSLRYFYTSVSYPGRAEPQFYFVGYVDEQPFVSYNAASRRVVPRVPWMEEVGKEDSRYWDDESRKERDKELRFNVSLATLQDRYNHSRSTGVHVLQEMYGCEVGLEGRPQAGYDQFGYDGEDFISFDKETKTWTAPVPEALLTKRKWEAERTIAQHLEAYLEETCVEWLQRYLDYGKETLERTLPPTVKVARRKHLDGLETLTCQAHGFYPKEIDVSWMKDGVQQQDTMTGGVVPNSDGTYHQWLSIEVDPQDRDRYRCHVEHDGLPETLDLAWEETASSVNLGCIMGVLVGVHLAAVLECTIIYYKKRNRAKGGYAATVVPVADA